MSLADLQTAIFKPQRTFGSISVQVAIEELHRDELFITEHPVEQGAAITDHAYKRPAELVLRMAWSNSGLGALINDFTAVTSLLSGQGEGGFSYIQEIYNSILELQESRIPFDIITGKRKYTNMLIRDITTSTTEATENSLVVSIHCRQILIVQTQVVNFPDAAVMTNPQNNAATNNVGFKQPSATSLKNINGTLVS